jgi:hypothetical protein
MGAMSTGEPVDRRAGTVAPGSYRVGRGDEDGSPRPLTSVAPLRRFGRIQLAVVFLLARCRKKHFFAVVQRMGLVHAMRWSVVRPFAKGGDGNERRAHLLFETNFSGGWDEYIEGFARSVPTGMHALFRMTDGYPGLRDNPRAFVDFVRLHDYAADFYYAAYETASALGVQRALLRRRLGADADGLPEMTVDQPVPIRGNVTSRSLGWTEIVLKVSPGEAHLVRRKLARAVDGDGDATAFADTFARSTRLHFARMLVLDFRSGSYLVFTCTFDAGNRTKVRTRPGRKQGTGADVALAELVRAGASEAPGPESGLRWILQHCDGYPVPIGETVRDADALVTYLLSAERPHGRLSSLVYCAYPDTSVFEVRDALGGT